MNRSGHLDDEALSALLDGQATAGDGAHVRACARCRHRADQLRAVAALVGAPAPAPPGATDDAVARALAAGPALAPPPSPPRPPPLPPPRRRWPAVVAAAAAVAALALAVPRLTPRTGDDITAAGGGLDAADPGGPQAAGEAESGAGEAGSAAEGAEGTAGVEPAPLILGDLGAVSAEEALARLEGATDLSLSGVPPPGGRPRDDGAVLRPCEAELRAADPALGGLRAVGTATVAGRPAALYAFGHDRGGGRRLVAVATEGCVLMASRLTRR